jgi:hypothetical protein
MSRNAIVILIHYRHKLVGLITLLLLKRHLSRKLVQKLIKIGSSDVENMQITLAFDR